jgi:di/tricarboxylate transporter
MLLLTETPVNVPISVVTEQQMGIAPEPVLIAVGVATAASFLTPGSTTIRIVEPGNHKFTDYGKFGLPFMLWFFVLALFRVPLIWGF